MVSDRLKSVILNELAVPEFDIQDETTATMVPNWDSLSHINVILAIEKEYTVKFKSLEILKVKNIGQLQRLIDSKLAAKAT
ncbi:MAG: acyl carrier protein [Candidatus Binatia bacterium]|jgi:acyl carrier protein